MRPVVKIDDVGVGRVETMLRNIAEKVPTNARKTMRRAAERIINRAKIYVPEDTEALKESIRMEIKYGVRGRLEINILFGGRTVIRDGIEGRRLVNLDEYALRVHEAYNRETPGEKTAAKMALYPGKVGERFLTRAFDDDENNLERDLIRVIERTIAEEDR